MHSSDKSSNKVIHNDDINQFSLNINEKQKQIEEQ